MKRSKILEERRKHVDPEIRKSVDLSFQIVDRIHDILVSKGMKQKDLCLLYTSTPYRDYRDRRCAAFPRSAPDSHAPPRLSFP